MPQISQFLNDSSYQKLIDLFPDLRYEENYLGYKGQLYTKDKKFKSLCNVYKFEFGSEVNLIFFYKFENKEIYFGKWERYKVGLSNYSEGKNYIKCLENLEDLKKKLIKEGYDEKIIDKALNEVRSLEKESSPLEKLMGDRFHYLWEPSKELTIDFEGNENFKISVEEINQICELLKVDKNNMQLKFDKNDDEKICGLKFNW